MSMPPLAAIGQSFRGPPQCRVGKARKLMHGERRHMRRMATLAVLLALFAHGRPALASADFHGGSLYRSAGVPAWSGNGATFTVMLWVYAPAISGANDYFMADDGGAFQVYVNLGSASDDPTGPYFLTRNGEWHFNRDGSYTANPAQSFDVSVGWTFLAVSFTHGGASDLYAWQAGVNGGALVHIPVQSTGASLSGSGVTRTFFIGNESGFGEGCACLLGPVYVYDGVALSQAQIDAQRQALSPLITTNLIAYSPFTDSSSLAIDGSGTANWSTHGTVRYSAIDPPSVPNGGSTTGGTTGDTTGATTGSTTGSTSGSTTGDSGGSTTGTTTGGATTGGGGTGDTGAGGTSTGDATAGSSGGGMNPAALLALLVAALRRAGRDRRRTALVERMQGWSSAASRAAFRACVRATGGMLPPRLPFSDRRRRLRPR